MFLNFKTIMYLLKTRNPLRRTFSKIEPTYVKPIIQGGALLLSSTGLPHVASLGTYKTGFENKYYNKYNGNYTEFQKS